MFRRSVKTERPLHQGERLCPWLEKARVKSLKRASLGECGGVGTVLGKKVSENQFSGVNYVEP